VFILSANIILYFLVLSNLESSEIQNLLKLRNGVCELLESLPNVSHMCSPLLHYISKHLPVNTTANWFNVSQSTVKSAHNLSTDTLDASLLFVERFVSDTMYIISILLLLLIKNIGSWSIFVGES
jgi:hypothetical protein